MPQIPVARSERTIPGNTGSAFMPTADPIGAAIERAGAQTEAVATKFLNEEVRLNLQMQAAERHVEATKHDSYLKDWIGKQAESFKGRTDYDKFDEDIEKGIGELSDYVGKIQDPLVRKSVEAAAQSTFNDYRKFGRAKKAQAITDVGKAELDRNLQFDLQEWVRGSSEAPIGEGGESPLSERSLIKERMTAKITEAAKAGIIKESEAVNQIQRIDSITEEIYAKSLLNSDPGRALQEIPNLPNLDPIKQQNMLATAVTKIEHRDRLADRQFKQTQEEAEQQVMDRIEAQDPAGALELLQSFGERRLLTPEKRRVLRAAIDSETKKEAKSDPEAFYELETRVLLGQASIRDVLNARDVAVSDKNKLIKLYKEEKDPRKSYDYTEAMKSAHNEIITTGPMAALDPDQQARFTAYKRAAEKNIQAGGDPWEFFDKNVWKYRPGVPPTIYGAPKSMDEVTTMRARLRADVSSGKIKAGQGGVEAEKLEKAADFITKRDKVRNNGGNK